MTTTINENSATRGEALARRLRAERERRGWPLASLADRSGVSKAMISKVERGEASPTAATLEKISMAFGMTMSALFQAVDGSQDRLRRAHEQHVWTDPNAHYEVRQISPSGGSRIDLVEFRLPPGIEIAFPAAFGPVNDQVIWAVEGSLWVDEGDQRHRLYAGDCLAIHEPKLRAVGNPTRAECRCIVAVARL